MLFKALFADAADDEAKGLRDWYVELRLLQRLLDKCGHLTTTAQNELKAAIDSEWTLFSLAISGFEQRKPELVDEMTARMERSNIDYEFAGSDELKSKLRVPLVELLYNM